MIPYYNPHYEFKDLLKTLFCRDAEERLKHIFRELTGKRYILITSSCRSALYLAYKALGKSGKVHTSPLTCKVALLPILAAGNSICFHDVRTDDWTMNPESIPASIAENSIAIQAIHLGGFSCDMPSLKRIAHDHKLVLIEDCAQAFGASYDGISTGTLGDISCFTLTKNLFSLGGGVLATDNKEWYLSAYKEQESFVTQSILKSLYRTVLAIVTTYRNYKMGEVIYQQLRRRRINYESQDDLRTLRKELKIPPSLYAKSLVARWAKVESLIRLRRDSTVSLIEASGIPVDMRQHNPRSESSFVKLFILSHKHSQDMIRCINHAGAEAMHLEHRHQVYYQEKLLSYHSGGNSVSTLQAYNRIHDRLLSLPLTESESDDRFDLLLSLIKGFII